MIEQIYDSYSHEFQKKVFPSNYGTIKRESRLVDYVDYSGSMLIQVQILIMNSRFCPPVDEIRNQSIEQM